MKKIFIYLLCICVFISCTIDANKDENRNISKSDVSYQVVTVDVDGLPYRFYPYDEFYLRMVFWNNDTNLGYIDVKNPIKTPRSFKGSYNVPREYTKISLFLFIRDFSDDPKYFIEINKNEAHKYINKYWQDYDEYFKKDNIKYALSTQLIKEATIGNEYTCDFNANPYYIFKLSNIRGEFFAYKITNDDESIVANQSYCMSFIRNGHSDDIELNKTHYMEDSYYEDMYFLIKPKNNNFASEYKIEFNYFNEQDFFFLKKRIDYKNIVYGNDDLFYISKKDSNELIQFDFINKKYKIINRFHNNIENVVSKNDNSKLYISEGANIWEYEISNSVLTSKYTGNGDILSLFLTNSYLISSELKHGTLTQRLLDRINYTVYFEDHFSRHKSKTYAYSNSENAIYMLNDGIGPDDFVRLKIDTTINKLFPEEDSKYHGRYTYEHPVKIFPDESKIIEGSGNIFRTDSDMTYIDNLGYEYNDLIFNNNYIYLINNNELVVLSLENYTLVSTLAKFDNDVIGEKIFINNDKVIFITKHQFDHTLHYHEYSLVNSRTIKETSSSRILLESIEQFSNEQVKLGW